MEMGMVYRATLFYGTIQYGTYLIFADPNVDEDPDEDRYGKEAQHRAFILGIGKLGFVFLLSILFLFLYWIDSR